MLCMQYEVLDLQVADQILAELDPKVRCRALCAALASQAAVSPAQVAGRI